MRANFEDGGAGGGPGDGGRRDPETATRPLMRSLGRGARGLCPACGTGAIFDGFLTVTPRCRACGEDLHHHRADDLPPYVTIFVVGHVVVSGLLITERLFRPDVWVQMAIWLPVTVLLALALLRPIKGAVVALQWALGMHGFGRRAAARPRPAETP